MSLLKNNEDSFYLDDELIDLEWLAYEARSIFGGRIHQISNKILPLRFIAFDLMEGYDFNEDYVREIVKEVKAILRIKL